MSKVLPRVWPAPAKLNLMLRILGRRDDGYHNLQTVFQFLDYGDELEFRLSGDGVISRRGGPAGVSESHDLVVRAAQLLQNHAQTEQGVEITLLKQLPCGGGLGGGSSDAATTLVALNELWEVGLEIDELAALGAVLGADVPVFVRGYAAWGEGIGEQLTPIDLPEPWYLVVEPGPEVSTAGVFQDSELTRNSKPLKIGQFNPDESHNDCEAVVFERYPEVAAAAAWMAETTDVRLTGTGGCLFAAFDRQSEAAHMLSRLPGTWQGFIARGCNRSPLADAADYDNIGVWPSG